VSEAAPSQRPTPNKVPAFIALAALVGLPTAHALMKDTRADEHREYRAYRDLNGVWTICDGTAHGVRAGDTATDAQCDAKTADDLLSGARIVLRCSPDLKAPERHNQLRASIRFQNNTGKFCISTGHRLMNQHRWRAGCDALLAYNGIISTKPLRGAVRVRRLRDGRYFNEIRGLDNRRANEHAVCVEGLA